VSERKNPHDRKPDKGSSKKGIVSVFPVLKNPVVAFFAGIAILFLRGLFIGGCDGKRKNFRR
jgi:hypothetical protein